MSLIYYLMDWLLAYFLPDPAAEPLAEPAPARVTYTATAVPVVVTASRLLEHDVLATVVRAWQGRVTDIQHMRLSYITSSCNAYEVTDLRHIAYILATAWHETARLTDLTENRALPGTTLRRLQDRYWHTGYWGRGYIQTTWRSNYEKLSHILSHDFVSNPNDMLIEHYAAESLVVGMRDGIYTGRRLSDYLNDSRTDWRNARRIVNGLDKSQLIASYARVIFLILQNLERREYGARVSR